MSGLDPLDVLSEILDDVPDLVISFSGDGRFFYMNRSAAAFLAADPLNVIGCHWQDLGFSKEIMEPLISRVTEVADNCAPLRYRFTTSEAEGSKTFDLSLTPIRCGQGDAIAVLAVAHDISEFF